VPTVKANGIDIYYEVRGTGDPLVFIEGLSVDLTAAKGIFDEFSKSREVIAFDNRGAGRTEKPDAPYSVELMADDTFGLLEAIGIRRVHVVGMSMGGRIAISLTARHPELVKSLILVSTGPRAPNTLWRRIFFVLVEVPRRIGALGKKYPQPNYAYKRQRKASQGYDGTNELGSITVPTLVMHGKRDGVAPYSLAVEMHEKIPGSKMLTFEGGHLFPFWRPRQFVEAVEDFLKTVP
jgi:3-oxoadipate enol-lactonase